MTMRNRWVRAGWISLLGGLLALSASAEDKPARPDREILVPFEDLHLIFQHPDQQRVLLTDAEFQELIKKAKVEADAKAPVGALFSGAAYEIQVKDEQATFSGRLTLQVIEEGLHALVLPMNGLGLQAVLIDGKGAPIGKDKNGRLLLFVDGVGEHEVVLQAVAPIQTTAARQTLDFRVPQPGATRIQLTIAGDVEVKSGAAVVSRTFDAGAAETRFELLAEAEQTALVMSLNSRLKRQERAVVARTVLVDEVTGAYERMNATISLDVLHRAVGDFRFKLPEGFDITEVSSPNLARWEVVDGILQVAMRDELTGAVLINISGLKNAPDLANWTMPTIEPLDVVGHVAVVGMLAEEHLEPRNIKMTGAITLDNAILMQAIPQTFLNPDPGAAKVRSVKAYYAPVGRYALSASFEQPEKRLYVTSSMRLLVSEDELTANGFFTLLPSEQQLFHVDIQVPTGWEVTSVTRPEGGLAYERYGDRVHVRLLNAVEAGKTATIFFTARQVPSGWLDAWESQAFDLPVFSVAGAHKDVGAILIDGITPLRATIVSTEGLTPLDENDKARFGLAGETVDLAYRYETPDYTARLEVERIVPRMTAEVYSFYHVKRDVLGVRYELIYSIEQAEVDEVTFTLPADTPDQLSVVGLNGVTVKETFSTLEGSNRVWRAHLTESQADRVHLAVDVQWPLAAEAFSLPVPIPLAVAYQSGLIAVEGSPELDVRIEQHPRPVDVGELAEADYLPGRRLLGAFGYVGEDVALALKVTEHPGVQLPPALIERAEMVSSLAANGLSQSSARFLLRSSAVYVEIRLPEGSDLWSAVLDGEPIKPQQDQNSILLELSMGKRDALRDLQVVYETPVRSLGYKKRVELDAPRIFLHQQAGATPREVPVTDLKWQLYLPDGYEVVGSDGNVVTDDIEPPATAVTRVGELLYRTSGGVNPNNGLVGLVLSPFAASSARVREMKTDSYYANGGSEQEEMAASSNHEGGDNSVFFLGQVIMTRLKRVCRNRVQCLWAAK